jgi:hypothetical protein
VVQFGFGFGGGIIRLMITLFIIQVRILGRRYSSWLAPIDWLWMWAWSTHTRTRLPAWCALSGTYAYCTKHAAAERGWRGAGAWQTLFSFVTSLMSSRDDGGSSNKKNDSFDDF